jgi:transposase-like protein
MGKRRYYSEKFKREAVELSLNSSEPPLPNQKQDLQVASNCFI